MGSQKVNSPFQSLLGFQVLNSNFIRIQGDSGGFRRRQEDFRGFRKILEDSEGLMRNQEDSTEFRRIQEDSGGIRRNLGGFKRGKHE